jgi:replicative DNA helicase
MAAANALAAHAQVVWKAGATLTVVPAFQSQRNDAPAAEAFRKTPIAATLVREDAPKPTAAYAGAYAKAGFPPVVLRPYDKRPAFPGWQTMPAITVVEILRELPAYNLGIAIPDGHFILDIDVKNGATGLETLRAWEAQHGPLEGMLVQHTGTGGLHYLFKLPSGVRLKNAVSIAPGIDIRAKGGYIVAEPSTVNGNSYGWDDYDVPNEAMPEIPLAPDWLISLCPKHGDAAPAEGIEGSDTTICEGQRNDTLFRKASALRGQGLNELEIRTALHGVNERLCEPPLVASEVAAIAKSAATYQPNPIPVPLNRAQRREFALQVRTAARLFVGAPKPVKWLVERVFPIGKVIIVASPPGIGKSMSALELAVQITLPAAASLFDGARFAFGGRVAARGRVVIISAEDDEEELHRRLYMLLGGQPMPEKLHIVSLPDQGHFCIAQGDQRAGVKPTAEWSALKEEILQLDDVVMIVVDTLQAVSAGDLNAAEIAQAMMNELVELANQTGAAVIALHHLVKGATKDEKGLLSAQQAMDAIRGSGAIAGSARPAYCLFPHPKGKEICTMMGVKYEENKVVYGLVAKANGAARRDRSIYIRDENGVLGDRTMECRDRTSDDAAMLLRELCDEVTNAYHAGNPYAVSKTSNNGLHRRRDEMPPQFHNLPADWFAQQAQALVSEGKLQKVKVKNGFQYAPIAPVNADATVEEQPDNERVLAVAPPPARAVKPKKKARRRKTT